MAVDATRMGISIPRKEAAAIANKGDVHSTGISTPERTISRLEKAIAVFVRVIEYKRCAAMLTKEPKSVPNATPIAPNFKPKNAA